MPRVHFVKKARKDNPAVQKGQPYYWWKFMYSPKRCSATRPRPSQLTQSDKLSSYYEAQETVEDIDTQEHVLDIVIVLEEVAESVRGIGEEYQESADNIREYFEESDTADECEEKCYMCEGTAFSIEEAVVNLEALTEVEEEAVQEVIDAIEWEM